MAGAFPIEEQLQDKWCWAAVASSVDHYYFPASTSSQCIIANNILGRSCCGQIWNCNIVAHLQDALGTQGVNRLVHPPLPYAIPFDTVKQEIDDCNPVCVRIAWYGGSAHFVVIVGYRIAASGRQFVEVADPFFPDSVLPYDEFLTAYQNAEMPMGGGSWSATFLLREQP